MSIEQNHGTLHCPSCAQPMRSMALARYDGASLTVDLCAQCYVIWFDQHESTQLAPEAVIALFQEIHAHREGERHPLSSDLHCPRCTGPLVLSHDICKAGPLTYYRCQNDKGRLTPFFQFLREKQFVRSLSPAELNHVRAEIKQVLCPSCGAPMDLEHAAACSYCGAPLAVLDADAVQAAMKIWAESATRRAQPTADVRVQSLTGTIQALSQQVSPSPLTSETFSLLVNESDLLACCIGALGKLIVSIHD